MYHSCSFPARQIKFPHRQNRDSSYDSICPVCFFTVANACQEDDLVRPETWHLCEHVHFETFLEYVLRVLARYPKAS